MVEKADIIIVGAGPGGAAAALTLAKQNISCVLLDKATFPRDKICGDAISGKVVDIIKRIDPQLLHDLETDPAHIGSWGVTFVAPNHKALRVPFRTEKNTSTSPPGFISRRVDFDKFLVDQVKKNDLITLEESTEVEAYQKRSEGWYLRSKAGKEWLAKQLIIANGAHSSFTRQFSAIKQESQHYCAGVRAYYKGVKGLDNENFIELHFLKDFLPGYFWIFPLANGYANVGAGMRSDKISSKKINLREKLKELIENDPAIKDRFKNATLEGDIKGYGLPLGSKKRNISGEGFLLVGDAASLIDPFTGEGIGNAMLSGYVAAKHSAEAIQKNNFSADFNLSYDKEVYQKLWKELSLSRRMQQLVEYPWLFNLVVNKANKNKTLRHTISCMFEDMDLRKQLKQPSFYFKLLFNSNA